MQSPDQLDYSQAVPKVTHTNDARRIFDLHGKVAVVTGATGVLGSALAIGLARAGAKVGILGRRSEAAEVTNTAIREFHGQSICLTADVLDVSALQAARSAVLGRCDRIDILVNCAGGNVAEAIVHNERTFFNLSQEAAERVVNPNLHGTLRPSQIFGEVMANQKSGSIINISSMRAQKPLTRVIGYSVAKAAVENLTRWLAVELAKKFGEGIRVNAIAPGLFSRGSETSTAD
jgi:NAD(P)-dependent dehydrogenase (short-subunit alcohol dehydrogenase family)